MPVDNFGGYSLLGANYGRDGTTETAQQAGGKTVG